MNKFKSLNEFKKKHNYTFLQLSKKLGISMDYACRICWGAIPSLKIAKVIAAKTGIHILDILGLPEHKTCCENEGSETSNIPTENKTDF